MRARNTTSTDPVTASPAHSSEGSLRSTAGQGFVVLLDCGPVVPLLPVLQVATGLLKPRPLRVVDPEVDVLVAVNGGLPPHHEGGVRGERDHGHPVPVFESSC